MKRAALVIFAATAGVAAPLQSAAACACCAERGTFRAGTVPAAKIIAMLQAVRQRKGTLGAGAPGTRAEPEEQRTVRVSSVKPSMIVLTSPKGKLEFRPTRAGGIRSEDISFAAGRDKAGGAVLLHSYSLVGQVTLSGELEKVVGTKLVGAVLIVRGAGNACIQPSNMKTWFLLMGRGTRIAGHVLFRER